MSDKLDLSPARFAALVAPAIDRAFGNAMQAARDNGGHSLVLSYGGRAAAGLIDLRNPFAAGRSLGRDEIVDVYPYRDVEAIWSGLLGSVEAGLLTQGNDGRISATDRGHAFLNDLFALHAAVLAERWEEAYAERVQRLVTLVGCALDAASATGGSRWTVHAPPHEPPDSTPGTILLNRLSTLRHHRADAHVAAWQAAGLTAAEIVAMPPGADRDAIEDDTDVRAAPPFEALTPDERVTLLADLAALP